MLKTTKVYAGLESLNEINSDLIQRIEQRRADTGVVADIDKELFRWSLESKQNSFLTNPVLNHLCHSF